MVFNDIQADHQGAPVIVSMSAHDFRTITRVCESACRHDDSEVLFSLLVDKESHQVQEIAIPRQTATPAHCDALRGEDLRIAEQAVRNGHAIYKAHSHGRSVNFSSPTDWHCAASLHATCAANCVSQGIELPVSVENRRVCLGSGGSIELVLPEGMSAESVDGWRARMAQTTGESAFYTFNAGGDKPCGVGLRLATHPATNEVTSHLVPAKVRIREDLPRALEHWTRERIDAEVDAKLRCPDGTRYVDRPAHEGAAGQTGDAQASPPDARPEEKTPDVAICIDSGATTKTLAVLPVEVFRGVLGRAADRDETGVLRRIYERLPSINERTSRLLER